MAIGFNSGGKHKTSVGKKPTREYTSWKHLTEKCNVCEEWLDFQNFAEWYNSHNIYRDDYRLVKGLLVDSDTYSPETCHLLPRAFVDLRLDSLSSTGRDLPTGVIEGARRNGKYIAKIAVEGKVKHLGSFNCPDEAHKAYVAAKEKQVTAVVNEYRDLLDDDVYESLINWKFPK